MFPIVARNLPDFKPRLGTVWNGYGVGKVGLMQEQGKVMAGKFWEWVSLLGCNIYRDDLSGLRGEKAVERGA
jgi:hypothetical protein